MIHIGSNIPKSKLFRFEDYWVQHPRFLETVTLHWNSSPVYANSAKNVSSKLKQVRSGLRMWSKNLSNLNKLIYNSNWILLLMDGLEEQRALSVLESAFRRLVKNHLATLLESKRLYWKQRNTVGWVTLGDENSSFFHTMATISHKRNFIVSVTTPDGTCVTEHEQKANIFWETYKQRLGCTEYHSMEYDLDTILQSHSLDHLDTDFSQQEIEAVIRGLSNSYAPGPDGFNGMFIKKCWDIIKDDFFRLFNDFCQSNIDLRSINSSIIAMIPKKG